MQIVEFAALPPGACYVTQRSDGPFIDTGLMIDDLALTGEVYLAVSFIADATQIIGGLGPDAVRELRERLAASNARSAELEQEAAALRGAIEGLLAAGYEPVAPVEVEA